MLWESSMNFEGRVIVITGASSGIGRETALAAGRLQASIVLAARRKELLGEVGREIEKSGGKALIIATDVSQQSDVENLIQSAIKQFGRIDVLINNAGTGLFATVEETSSEQMERLWRINFMGTFYGIRAALPPMKKQGSGHIITVSSMAGKRATPFGGAYSATKFAQSGLMESLRMELRNSPIRTTVIYPGPTKTDFVTVIENPGAYEIRHPLKAKSADEVAQAILQAIHRPKPDVILQNYGRALSILNSASPRFVDWVVASFVKKDHSRRK
jgi:short-subunit dehydrogenase